MANYIFDGTFEGMLSAIYQASYHRDKNGQIFFSGLHQEDLFSQIISVKTNPVFADKVYHAIKNKISREALEHVMLAFLTEDENIGTLVYRYLNFGWQVRNKLDMYLDDNRVKSIHERSRRVRFEKHRMLGLLRFRRLSLHHGVYYAPFEPDNNITQLLAPHFSRRLADQNWIIHDVKRSIAACYNKNEWMVTDLTTSQVPPLGEDEIFYQNLWKEYYQSIGIKERANSKLQRQMMPVRYWKYLTEKTP
jgi:probable DNA metabolism protein